MRFKKIVSILIVISTLQLGYGKIHPVIKSIIIPGWGELESGNKKRANQFFLQEAGIWLSFLGMKSASAWYEADFRAYASLHADVDMSNKSLQYATDIGDYNNYYEFVEVKKRNRQINDIWPEDLGYEWEWDSESNRRKFDKIRIHSGLADKYATFAIGGMVAHRLISMIDVLYLESKKRRYKIGSGFRRDNTGSMQFSVTLQF